MPLQWSLFIRGCYLTALLKAIYIILRSHISLLFTTKAEVMALAPEILIMVDCFLVIESLLCTGIGIMRGIQDVKIISYIPLLAYLVQNIHIGYLSGFVFDLGHSGLFVGYLFGFGTAATLYLMMNKYKIREFGKKRFRRVILKRFFI